MLPPLSGELEFFPIICLSASEHVPEGIERRHGYCYVQGSGDDHESWSRVRTLPLKVLARPSLLIYTTLGSYTPRVLEKCGPDSESR